MEQPKALAYAKPGSCAPSAWRIVGRYGS